MNRLEDFPFQKKTNLLKKKIGSAGLGTQTDLNLSTITPARRTGTSARSLPYQQPIGRCGKCGKAKANMLMYDLVMIYLYESVEVFVLL